MKANYKKLINSIISFALMLSVFICAIVVFSFDSMAWFKNNKNADSNGLNLNLEQGITLKSAQIIKADEEENIIHLINIVDPYRPTVNDSIVTTDLPDSIKPENYLKLNKYDTVFIEKNEFTPIILKLTLGNIYNSKFKMSVNFIKDLMSGNTNNNSVFETVIDEDSTKKYEMRSIISNLLEVRCIMNNTTLENVFNSGEGIIPLDDYNSIKSVFGVESTDSEGIFVNKPESEFITATNHVERTFVLYDEDSTKISGSRVTYTTNSESGDIISSTEKQNMVFKFDGNSPKNSEGDIDVYIYLGYNVVLMNEYIYHKTGSVKIGADALTKDNKVDFSEDVLNFSFYKLDN